MTFSPKFLMKKLVLVNYLVILKKHMISISFFTRTWVLWTNSCPHEIKFLKKFIPFWMRHERAPACAEACRCWRKHWWRQDSWSSCLLSPSSTARMAMCPMQELRIRLIIYYFYFKYIHLDSKSTCKARKTGPRGIVARAQNIKKPSRTAKLLLLPKH